MTTVPIHYDNFFAIDYNPDWRKKKVLQAWVDLVWFLCLMAYQPLCDI